MFELLLKDEIVSLPEGSRVQISAALLEGTIGQRISVTVRDVCL